MREETTAARKGELHTVPPDYIRATPVFLIAYKGRPELAAQIMGLDTILGVPIFMDATLPEPGYVLGYVD